MKEKENNYKRGYFVISVQLLVIAFLLFIAAFEMTTTPTTAYFSDTTKVSTTFTPAETTSDQEDGFELGQKDVIQGTDNSDQDINRTNDAKAGNVKHSEHHNPSINQDADELEPVHADKGEEKGDDGQNDNKANDTKVGNVVGLDHDNPNVDQEADGNEPEQADKGNGIDNSEQDSNKSDDTETGNVTNSEQHITNE
jgi:predicted ribosomally synthesized peptide with SipW-like signal peptide